MKKMDATSIARAYKTTFRLIEDNILNSFKKSIKTRDFNRMKRIRSTFVDDCFVLVTDNGGNGVIFIKIDGRWVFASERVDVEGNVFECFNIITEHCIERFRCRLNMYATPIEEVLMRFVMAYTNGRSFSTTTDRLGQTVYMEDYNAICPVTYSEYTDKNTTNVVCVIKTVLDQPDRKTNEVREKQEDILHRMCA